MQANLSAFSRARQREIRAGAANIDETLKPPPDWRIELFAVTTGPGSFTGLRSGLATIKAFAATLNRPVVGVPTLHAVAFACGTAGRVLASLPAGRGEVFAQLLSTESGNVLKELSEPFHLSPQALWRSREWGCDLTWRERGTGLSNSFENLLRVNICLARRLLSLRGFDRSDREALTLAPPPILSADRRAWFNNYDREYIVAEDLYRSTSFVRCGFELNMSACILVTN